jgi:hypothetical protein
MSHLVLRVLLIYTGKVIRIYSGIMPKGTRGTLISRIPQMVETHHF